MVTRRSKPVSPLTSGTLVRSAATEPQWSLHTEEAPPEPLSTAEALSTAYPGALRRVGGVLCRVTRLGVRSRRISAAAVDEALAEHVTHPLADVSAVLGDVRGTSDALGHEAVEAALTVRWVVRGFRGLTRGRVSETHLYGPESPFRLAELRHVFQTQGVVLTLPGTRAEQWATAAGLAAELSRRSTRVDLATVPADEGPDGAESFGRFALLGATLDRLSRL